jgi:hypothetical protein
VEVEIDAKVLSFRSFLTRIFIARGEGESEEGRWVSIVRGGEREREWIRGKWGREEVEWAAEGEEAGEGQNQ